MVNEIAIHLPAWENLPDIGIYMDQVMIFMDRVFHEKLPKGELTKPMINNYVKAGLLPRSSGKKYDRNHLARLLMICVLKQALSMESISEMLKGLCKENVHEGYELFRTRLEELDDAVKKGTVEMDWTGDTKEELTLRLGLTAALCTIQTYWLLSEQQEPGEQST